MVKILAMAEWAPLYRGFLFVPANALAFFRGSQYVEAAGVYTFPDFILDHSCSGVHFFIVALILTGLTPNPSPEGEGPERLPLLLLEKGVGGLRRLIYAYAITLIANTFRVALFLKLMPFAAGRPWLHEVVGTTVFIFFLILFSLLPITSRQRPGCETRPPEEEGRKDLPSGRVRVSEL